jgi:hypothetical protein
LNDARDWIFQILSAKEWKVAYSFVSDAHERSRRGIIIGIVIRILTGILFIAAGVACLSMFIADAIWQAAA